MVRTSHSPGVALDQRNHTPGRVFFVEDNYRPKTGSCV